MIKQDEGSRLAAELAADLDRAAEIGPTAVEVLEQRLDDLDGKLCALVDERVRLTRRLQVVRMDNGGPRYVHDRELSAVRRYRGLGTNGTELAALLLRMCR